MPSLLSFFRVIGRSASALAAALSLSLFIADICAKDSDFSWWRRLKVLDLEGNPLPIAGRALVVIFISPECPVSNGYVPVLNQLFTEFTSRGIAFVGVYADPTLDVAALRTHVKEFSIAFSTVDDRHHALVHETGATYTPEVFVFSPDGRVLYRGRIDDRVGDFGEARPAATRQELREVLQKIATGERGPFPGKPGFGCTIAQEVKS